MSQNLSVDAFKNVKNTSKYRFHIKLDNDGEYFLKVDIHCPEKLHDLHNRLPFLPERIKIENVEKLVANLHVKKKKNHTHRKLKQTSNHRLVLKKFTGLLNLIQNLDKIMH